MLRTRTYNPALIVDINEVDDQDYISRDGEWIRFGCLVRHVDVERSAVVRDDCPVLATAAGEIGDRQVRNRGTLCGAIAHNDPAGDPPALATLLDAEIDTIGPGGSDTYRGRTFFGEFYETEMADDAIVSEVRFPVLGDGVGAAYQKYEPSEGAYPVATAGATLTLADDVVTDVEIVVGAIEPGPTRLSEAADALEGREPTDDVVTEAAQRAGEDVMPIEDAEGGVTFKREITKTLTKQAITDAIDRARVDQ